MDSPIVWLFIWVLSVFASIMAHEIAHAIVGVKAGWKYHGMFFKPKVLGIGVKLEADEESPEYKKLWIIASAGPISSFIVAMIFLGLANITSGYAALIAYSLFSLNLVVAIFNLFPTPITDGGHILTSLFGWKMKWRYLLVPWVVMELLAVWFLF